MPMPVIIDVKLKSGKVDRINLPVEVWQRNTSWSFKHESTEEVDSIALDPQHVLPDNNPDNNIWSSATGEVEKDIILDGYLGTYSNSRAPIKIIFSEKNSVLNVAITDYPDFTVEPIGKDLFESKRAGLQFQFNDNKDGFDMIISADQKIPFTKDK